MYNEQLEQLIDAALTDGVLTEQEKSILFRKAQSFGIDLDEFNMVLSAKLHNKKKQIEAEKSVKTPVSNKYGILQKCPSCGAPVQSFQTHCSDCGFEFNVSESSEAIEKITSKLELLDDAIAQDKIRNSEVKEESTGLSLKKILLFIFFYYIFIPYYAYKVIASLTKGEKLTPREEQKKSYIETFSIPTNKAEMLELMVLMHSNLRELSYIDIFDSGERKKNTWNKIWVQKMSYIRDKAVIAMTNNTKDLQQIQQMYDHGVLVLKKNTIKMLISVGIPVGLFLLFILAIIISGS